MWGIQLLEPLAKVAQQFNARATKAGRMPVCVCGGQVTNQQEAG